MSNNKSASIRWAVANDFVDRVDVNYEHIDSPKSRHDLDYADLVGDAQEMKPLPRRPVVFRNHNDLTIRPGHAMLRLSEDGTYKLDSFV